MESTVALQELGTPQYIKGQLLHPLLVRKIFEVVGASQVVLLATCQRGSMRQMSAGDVDRWPCHRSSRTGAHVAV